jgi:sugar phosphate isomerase/epimerase
MKIGYMATLDKAPTLREAGYDFIEDKLLSHPLTDPDAMTAAKRAIARAELPTLVFSSFFPHDMRLVGPDVDATEVKDYLARAAELTHAAGAHAAVVGSAWSRNVPDGWEYTQARDQLLDAYSWAADAFQGTGVVLGIEPQCRKEANIITTVPEAVDYARTVNRPEIKVSIDFYHIDEEDEPLDKLSQYGEWIVHVQLADSDRKHPGTGSYDYATFFQQLRQFNYSGHLTVEIMHDIPPAEMRHSLEFLRRHWPAGTPSHDAN